MEPLVVGSLRNAGWVLLVGGALAIIGAFWPPYKQWSSPLAESLRIIHTHPIGWRCIHAGFVSGTVLSAFGLALLAYGLRGRAGGEQALLVAVAWGFGAVLWIANIGMRLTVTPWAAAELVATGELPPSYAPWRAFQGALFAGFSALGYASVAGLGWTILRSAIAPVWSGWLFVVWGLSGGFVVGLSVPFIAYVPFVLLGGLLLRSS